MNKQTISRRLNTAQLILLALVLVGVGIGLWVQNVRTNSNERHVNIRAGGERIRTDFVLMSDGLRGLLLHAHDSERDLKKRHDAEADLTAALRSLQAAAGDFDNIVYCVRRITEFNEKSLAPHNASILQLIEADPAAALALYNEKTSRDIRDGRDKLLFDLTQETEKVAKTDSIQVQTTVFIGTGLIVLVALGALFVGMFQSSSILQPLNELVAALDRMRGGDFSQRVVMDRQDEFGVLADGLNRLSADLSKLVGQVQRSGIQVNTTATEIAATAKEQETTATEIAATTAEIGATSKEISATSKELVKTMNEVSGVSEDTAELANSGQAAITRMESNMKQIIEASGSITAKLAVLNEKTANINSVVTTITKVADQTNLLSLNAAIEAEKAGEYGLGFAVVAMEIRRLADQTAVATYDIEKMVKEMQSAVAAGVMGMDKFSEEVRRGVEEIRQVSTQLAQIIHQVQTLSPRYHTVNEGMNAQSTGAQQISETLTQLSDAAHQTAESLRQSNLAIEQLNDAARGLQTSVARFKLESP